MVNFLSCLFQNCHLLKRMDLDDCVLITDAVLSYLSAGCCRLEKLVRFHICDDWIIENNAVLILFLWQSLSHGELITDEGIGHVCMSPCAAEHLPVLELTMLIISFVSLAQVRYLKLYFLFSLNKFNDVLILFRHGIYPLATSFAFDYYDESQDGVSGRFPTKHKSSTERTCWTGGQFNRPRQRQRQLYRKPFPKSTRVSRRNSISITVKQRREQLFRLDRFC